MDDVQVFWLPPDSEEKISLSITVLLAFFVFQFVVTELTPTSSDSTPIIGVFVMVTIGLSTISVVTSILLVRLSGVSRPIPRWVRNSVFRMIARAMCTQFSPPSKSAVPPQKQPQSGDARAFSTSKLVDDSGVVSLEDERERRLNDANSVSNKIDDVLNELRKMTERQQAIDEVAQMADDWRTLATVIDRLLFTASFIVLLAIAFWMIAKSLEQPDVEALGAIPAVFEH